MSFLVAKVLKYEVIIFDLLHASIKVTTIMFQFSKYQPLTYNVMLVLLSFIISWGEVWFFDLRMIPLERKAKEIWGDYQAKVEGGGRGTGYEGEEERRPLLVGPTVNGPSEMMARFIEGSTLYEGSIGNFHTPFDSPNASDDEDDEDESTGVRIPRKFRRRRDHPLTDQVG